jgi:hypothetical protein
MYVLPVSEVRKQQLNILQYTDTDRSATFALKTGIQPIKCWSFQKYSVGTIWPQVRSENNAT